MIVEINGCEIRAENDFHTFITNVFDVGGYYGENLDALFDLLSRDIERPLTIIWSRSDLSKQSIGEDDFNQIISTFDAVRESDMPGLDPADVFSYELR